MKNILLFISTFFIILPITHAHAAMVYCRSSFTDQIVEITSQSKVDSCVADLIWGTKNVCFKGFAEDFAALVNAGEYEWLSSGYSATEAKVVGEGVTYIGTDAMSFYSAKRTLYPCTDEFF